MQGKIIQRNIEEKYFVLTKDSDAFIAERQKDGWLFIESHYAVNEGVEGLEVVLKKNSEEYDKAAINVIDTFRKMCNYIEQSDHITCAKCPVFKDCFYGGKHSTLYKLMQLLGIKRE